MMTGLAIPALIIAIVLGSFAFIQTWREYHK